MRGRALASLAGGLLLVAAGLVWALQGAGILGGSAMSDERIWLWIGVVTAALGVALAYRGLTTWRRGR